MKHTIIEHIEFLLPKCKWCVEHPCEQDYIEKRFRQLIVMVERLLNELERGE